MVNMMTFNKEEAFSLLKSLVAVRSYPGEEEAAQQVCAIWMNENGMRTRLVTAKNGQPNVIAEIDNGPGPALLLNGHMDTVLAAEGWKCDPWQGMREGDLFYALGAADMKCGVVANMLVARELARNKHLWKGTLIFSSVTDEEALSMGAHALMDSGLRADACIVTEPFWDGAVIGAPGKILIQVDVTGKAAHGFLPWEGINAGIEAARFAAQVCSAVPEVKHPLVPSSQTLLSIHAGSPQYVITLPEKASVLLTRQIVPGETRDDVLSKLRAFADSLQSPATFEFSVRDPFYTPWSFDQPDHVFTRAFSSAYQRVRGRAPEIRHWVGITDANVINGESGIPCIVFGPRGGNFHQCQEWVDLVSIPVVCDVVAGTATAFLQG